MIGGKEYQREHDGRSEGEEVVEREEWQWRRVRGKGGGGREEGSEWEE